MSRRVFIDAMNVIRSDPSLARIEDKHGSAAAKRELMRLIRLYMEREGSDAEHTVVFDGMDSNPMEVESAGMLHVIYSCERTADEVIIEKADDARALGHEAWIVSNDAEVCSAGTQTIRSEEFYETLIHRRAPREPVAKNDLAKRLVAHLVAAGRLPSNATNDSGLVADLARHLEYYLQGTVSAQKLAKKLESVFHDHTNVTPDPDPQKIFYRELKGFFSRERTS